MNSYQWFNVNMYYGNIKLESYKIAYWVEFAIMIFSLITINQYTIFFIDNFKL